MIQETALFYFGTYPRSCLSVRAGLSSRLINNSRIATRDVYVLDLTAEKYPDRLKVSFYFR